MSFNEGLNVLNPAKMVRARRSFYDAVVRRGPKVSETCDFVEFGPFRLHAARRLLTRDGKAVVLSSRAFDILALLVEHRDHVMTKDDIITQVWRGIVVEENNLAVQVSSLRRALGEAELDAPLILTVPGQGYRFVGRVAAPPVSPLDVPSPPESAAPPAQPADAPTPAHEAAVRTDAHGQRRPMMGALAGAAGLALLLLLVLVLALRRSPPAPPNPTAPPRLSIAVLPFRDLSDDRCCAYLADAVSDDITTDLSHIPGSVVIARESSDVYRDRALPTAQIGTALNVRYLLEGSLRAQDDNFSINAQLIEAGSSAHLWAERFTVPRHHLGQAQDTIVHRIASALGVKLFQIEGSTATREKNSDPDALDLFFQARSILDRSDTQEAMRQARDRLEQAIGKQPDFADALAELAWLLPRKASTVDPDEARDIAEVRHVVSEALRYAPDSPLALAAQGALLRYDGRCDAARPSYEAALALNPGSVNARTGLILCLTDLGRFEEVEQRLHELLQIDPEGAANRTRYYRLGFATIMLGRPAEALEWFARSQAGEPPAGKPPEPGGRAEWTRLLQIAALSQTGRPAAAREAYEAYQSSGWTGRTVWRVGAKFTRAQASLPGAARVLAALRQAGMPDAADEHEDQHVPPAAAPTASQPFQPTPVSVPGAAVIDTPTLRARLAAGAPPRIVNMKMPSVVLPGTINLADQAHAGSPSPCLFDPLDSAQVRACAGFLRQGGRDGGSGDVVVMGANARDWCGYNAALALAQAGVSHVLWYRGGAEAWALSGAPFRDVRPY